MPILYVRDSDKNFVPVPAIIGPRGPQGQGTSAYDAAKEAGYTGTEEEFNAALADIENKVSKTEAQAMADTAETNAKAASDPKGSAAAAQKAAIAAAAEDATAKADTAESNAKAASDPKGSAEMAKSEAIAEAAADATTKANAAESNAKAASDPKGSAATAKDEAIAAAAEDATNKANNAEANAKNASLPKAGGTMTGALIAASGGQTPDTSLLRNSKLVAAETTPTVNGEIYWIYG